MISFDVAEENVKEYITQIGLKFLITHTKY